MLTLLDVANDTELPFTQAQFTLLAAAFVDDEWGPHQMCSLVACRLPLHPGPCKGWKHTLHLTAPGVYHALESSRVEKANQKRLAKIAALKAEGKKVPAALLKPITYSLPKPPPEHQIGQHAEVVGGEAHKAAQAANKSAGVVANPAPKLHDEKLNTAGVEAAEKAKDTLGEAAKTGNGYSPAMHTAMKATANSGPIVFLAALSSLSKSDYDALSPADRKQLDAKLDFVSTHKQATGQTLEKAVKLKAYFAGPKKAEPEKPAGKDNPLAEKVAATKKLAEEVAAEQAAHKKIDAGPGTPLEKKIAKTKALIEHGEPGKHTLGEAVKSATTQGVFVKPAEKSYEEMGKADFDKLSAPEKKAVLTQVAQHFDKGTPAQKQAANDFMDKIAPKPEPAAPSKVGIKGQGTMELKTAEPVKQHQGVATHDAITGKPHADFLDSFSKMTAKDYTDLPLSSRVAIRHHLQTISLHGNSDNAAKASKLSLALHQVGEMKPGTTFGGHDSAMKGSEAKAPEVKAPAAKGYNYKQKLALTDATSAMHQPTPLTHGVAIDSIGALSPGEIGEMEPADQKIIKDALSNAVEDHGPASATPTLSGAHAHAMLAKLNAGTGDEEVSPGVKGTLAQLAKPAKESVNALPEEAKGTGGSSVNSVEKKASSQLSEKALAAHDLANSKGFVMSKAHLETYEPLSKDDFVSLDPATQTTIKAQLAVALTKLKDPKKIAATQELLDKFIDATGGPGTAKPLPAAEAAKIAEKTAEAAPKIDVPAGYNPAQAKAKLAILSTNFDDDTVLDHVWNLSKADLDGMTQDEKTALVDKVTAIKSKPGQHVVTSSVASKLLAKWGAGETAKPEESKAPEVKPEPVKINHVEVPTFDTTGNTWPDSYTDDMKQAATMAHQAGNGTGPNLTFQQKATIVDKLTADDWAKLKESHKGKLITQINQMDESGVQGVDGLRERFGLAKPGGPSPYAGEKPPAKPVTIVAPGGVHGTTEEGGPNHLAQIQSADFNGVGPGNAWPSIKALTPEEFKNLTPSQRHAVSHYLAEIATHDVAATTKAKELGAKLPDKTVGQTTVPGHYSQLQVNAIKAPKSDYYATSDKIDALNQLNHQDFTELTPAHQQHIMGFLDETIAGTSKTSALYGNAAKAKAVLSGESGSKAKAATLKEAAAAMAGNAEQQKKDAVEQVHAALGKDVTATDEEVVGKAYRSAMVKGAKEALYYGSKGKWQAQQSIKTSPLKDDLNASVKDLYDKTEALAVAHLYAHAGSPGAAEKLKAAEADYKAAHAKADGLVAQARKDAGLATKHIPQWNAKPNQTHAASDMPYQIGGYGKPLAGHSPAAYHYLIAKLGDKNATTTYHYTTGNKKLADASLKEAADLEKNFEYFDQQHVQAVEAAKKKLAANHAVPAKAENVGAPSPATAAALGVHFMPEGPTLGTGGYGTTAFDGMPAYVSPDYAAWAERGQEAAKGQDAIKKYKRIDQLTGATKSAFVSYTGGGYEAINQELMKAGPGGKVTGQAHLLKKAYEDTPVVDTDVVLFRGLRRMSQKFGAQANDTNMVGASFDQLGASSTSVQQSTADNFAHLGQDPFVIRILLRQGQKFRGVNAQEGGQHESEAEVILEPGLRYTVVADYGVINGRRRFDVVVDRIPTAQ